MTANKDAPPKRFLVKAQNPNGTISVIEFSDTSERDAMQQVVARGIRVISLEPVKDETPTFSRNSQFPLLLFGQELLALLDAGLNLTEALNTLHAKEKAPFVKSVLKSILDALREGKNFSDVLALFPNHFPEVYIASVRSSERTGDLPKVLERYIAYQLQFETIKKKLISASIYPVMLLVVGGFVTLFLVGYVVPKFSAVYESSGRELPWLSTILLGFGKLLYHYWQLGLVALIAGSAAIFAVFSRAEGRSYVFEKVLRIPWLVNKVEEFRLARFYRAVSLLLSAGLALPRAMGMVAGMLSPNQQSRLAQARQFVEQGQSFSYALQATNLASPVADSLIKVGEKSGQLAEMLERTARFHDEDLARWIDWASKLIEPILMAVIGLLIGTIVTLMYIPIFDLAGSLR
jgi:general secretion pathway protein F